MAIRRSLTSAEGEAIHNRPPLTPAEEASSARVIAAQSMLDRARVRAEELRSQETRCPAIQREYEKTLYDALLRTRFRLLVYATPEESARYRELAIMLQLAPDGDDKRRWLEELGTLMSAWAQRENAEQAKKIRREECVKRAR